MSTPLATAWTELGDLTGPPGPSGPTPGRRLNIGRLAGQNHFAVQVAVDGATAIETHDQDDIAGGYDAIPYYQLLADESAVQMRASVGGPTTPGTTYARCEHRELDLNGQPIAFNPFVGTHRMWGRHRITHLPPNKPELVTAQLHNGAADRVAIRTQVISGQTKLLCRINGSAVTPRFAEPYVLGTWFDWMIEVVDGQVRVYYNDMVTPLIVSNALVPTAGGATWYFKAGMYLQSDTTTDIATEYGAVDMADLDHWHTGWPTPRDRAGTPRHAGSHDPTGPDPLVGYARDADVVHLTGTETINGTKVFGSPPQVPVGTQLTHPVRRDDARLTDERDSPAAKANQPLGWPKLDASGLLATAVLPPVALIDVTPVTSQAQMLALTAQPGDVAVRSDLGRSFMLRTAPASTLANWQELLTPTDAVTSVNGRVGVVSGLAEQTALDAHTGGADPHSQYREHNEPPRVGTVAATVNVDGSAAGDVHLTCTDNTVITPTGTPNGRTLVIDLLASGGARTPSFATSVALTTGVTSRSLAIASGKVGRAVLRYSTLGSVGWSLDSFYLVG